jgi:hypothetical protein
LSLHDGIEDVETSIANLPAEKYNLIQAILKKQGSPDIISDLKKYPAIKWRDFDVHDYSGGPLTTKIMREYLDNLNLQCYHRIPPYTVTPSPLVDTVTDTGILFSSGIVGTSPDFGKKFGGGAKFDGSSYIIVNDDSSLNVTDKISIVGWLFIPAGASSCDIIKKNNQYHLYISAANTLSWRVYSGGAWKTPVSLTFSSDTIFHVAATYKSSASGQKIYKNSVSQATDSETGAIATSTNPLGIGNNGAGGTIIPANTRMAWLSILHDEMSQTKINNHLAGVLNTRDSPEIVTYPFTVSAKYESDMQPGNWHPS